MLNFIVVVVLGGMLFFGGIGGVIVLFVGVCIFCVILFYFWIVLIDLFL